MSATVHVAGPYVDLVQACVRCGRLITDSRNTSSPLRGWVEGEAVVIDGHASTALEFWNPANQVRPCVPPEALQ